MMCSTSKFGQPVCRRNYHVSLALFAALALIGAVAIGTPSAHAATATWTGASSNVWNTGSTGNWTGGTGTDFTNLDDVVFNNAGANKSITVAGPVVPGTITFNNTTGAGNNYTFSTNATNTIGGSGGTTITSSGTVIFSPTNAGTHSFGSGAIQLNNAGAVFAYTPVAGSTLTNAFVINAPVTWYRQSTNGTRTGTVTVNSNFNLSSDFVTPGVMENPVLLTGDRTVSGSLFFNIPTMSGQVTSSGVKRSLTINNTGDNPGWFFDISSPGTTAWDIKDLVLNTTVGNREATTRVISDERNFFTSMEANGGYLKVLTAGVQFSRAANAEIGFDIIIKPQTAGTGTEYGTGIRGNTSFTVVSGGGLHGTGIYRSGAPSCCNGGGQEFKNPLDVTVTGTGLISPGDPTAVNTAGVLTITGNLAFSGGQLNIDVLSGNAVAGTDYDRLVVMDSLTPSGRGSVTGISTANLVVDFHNVSFDDLNGDVLTILTSSLTNFTGQQFGSVTSLNTGDYFVKVLYGNGVIQLTFISTVPEPSTAVLLGLGLVGLVVKRRRQHAAQVAV